MLADDAPSIKAVLRTGDEVRAVPSFAVEVMRPAPALPLPDPEYVQQKRQLAAAGAARPAVPPPSAEYLASMRGMPPTAPLPPEAFVSAERERVSRGAPVEPRWVRSMS